MDIKIDVFEKLEAFEKEKLMDLDTLKIHFLGSEDKVLKQTLKFISSNSESVIEAYIKRHRMNPDTAFIVLKIKNNFIL